MTDKRKSLLALAAARPSFWAKVDVLAECWEWRAARTEFGYGKLRVSGRTLVAHRCSYAYHIGPIPDGLHVLHHCDNPPCVNPGHLFLGTAADNVRDMDQKGRRVAIGARGDRNSHAVLNEARVVQARLAFAGGTSIPALSERYGVSTDTVARAIRQETWRHTDGPVFPSTRRPGESYQEPVRGMSNGQAKLTDDDVREIRRLCAAGHRYHDVASRFGISRSNVGSIATGVTWKHLDSASGGAT